MKPKEFDELVRQKFEQNDFGYNPQNWDKLADELDGRAKKRSVFMWWWVPLTGIAASVALAIGVSTLLRQEGRNAGVGQTELVQKHIVVRPQILQDASLVSQAEPAPHEADKRNATKTNNKHMMAVAGRKNSSDHVGLQLHEGPANKTIVTREVNLLTADNLPLPEKAKDKKRQVEGVHTFKSEIEEKKAPKLSVILSGGISRGSQNNGYMAGATIRRMVNDKVFVEGDIAFASSSNVQATSYLDNTSKGARHSGAKIANEESSKTTTVTPAPTGVIRSSDVSYNLSYAQVTPSIGYKLMKRMSVALGPDFQQLLVDNRPAQSTVDRGTLQEAAVFDVGFIGKTEYSVTRNIKAAVSYRKGVNTMITLTDKYFDRDYLQFQLKCAIFNK